MEVVPQSFADDLLITQCLAKSTDYDVSLFIVVYLSSRLMSTMSLFIYLFKIDGIGDSSDCIDGGSEIGKISTGANVAEIAEVPKLPFDVDLYHWEDEHLTTPRILP